MAQICPNNVKNNENLNGENLPNRMFPDTPEDDILCLAENAPHGKVLVSKLKQMEDALKAENMEEI